MQLLVTFAALPQLLKPFERLQGHVIIMPPLLPAKFHESWQLLRIQLLLKIKIEKHVQTPDSVLYGMNTRKKLKKT